MKIKPILLLLVCSSIYNNLNAQVNYDTLLIGVWKGSSICQIKNSPCHDETVVYYISKKPGIDTFYINGNKIVNGVEEEMGILPFTLNKKMNQLISTSYGLWTFTIKQRKLEGTLVSKGALYRIINLTKQN
jgi:hypothetical protein